MLTPDAVVDVLLFGVVCTPGRSRTSSFGSRSRTHSSADMMDDDDHDQQTSANAAANDGDNDMLDTDYTTQSNTALNAALGRKHPKLAVVAGHEDFIAAGTYVELVIADVPLAAYADLVRSSRNAPLLLFSLLQFEQKLSVLQFQVMRDARYEAPVPSKER